MNGVLTGLGMTADTENGAGFPSSLLTWATITSNVPP
jgi:hypothetical protein